KSGRNFIVFQQRKGYVVEILIAVIHGNHYGMFGQRVSRLFDSSKLHQRHGIEELLNHLQLLLKDFFGNSMTITVFAETMVHQQFWLISGEMACQPIATQRTSCFDNTALHRHTNTFTTSTFLKYRSDGPT